MIPVLQTGAGFALAALMIVAGVSKLRAPDAARAAVATYELLPAALARRLALPLAAAETFAGLALALPASRAAGAAVALALLLLYTAAVASMLARGKAGRDCGCGGIVDGVPVGAGLLLRNLLLCALALACLAWQAGPPSGTQWLAAAGVGALLWTLLAGVDFLLARERQLADD
jgi:hypothetical protein